MSQQPQNALMQHAASGGPPTRKRAAAALVVAGISDLLSVFMEFIPPAQIALDLVTAGILWGLLSWRWPLLPALVAEAIPGIAIFPTWTMVAGAYLWWANKRPQA